MSEAQVGIGVLLIISTVTSAIVRSCTPKLASASAITALVSITLFQIAACVHIGYLDPFFLIALFVSAPISFSVALLVGLTLRKLRPARP
jgi:hypothetical protein